MHLIKKLIVFIIVFLFFTEVNASIYIVDNYTFTTTVKKIKKNRDKVIENIKQKSLNDFLKSITIEGDFKNLTKIKNYQEYFKLFIVKNEFKNNNNYELICKIEFNKNKIDSFFKKENIKYINYRSNPILTIIVNKKDNKFDIWATEKFDKYLEKKFNNLLNTFPLNGDLTDIKLLNEIDIRSYQIARFDKIIGNYGIRDYIFILFDLDKTINKENVFVKFQFNELKTSNRYDLANFNQKEFNIFFEKLLKNLNNSWKEIQILAPKKNTDFLFDYKLTKLSDYIAIKNIIKKNKKILSIKDTEITNKKYSGRIIFSGSLEQLREYLYDEGFFLKKKGNKFNLSKK
tara:strand:- start:4373 stop:5407 length:1035 start_codon:yes stop_codon:yes gene_type:complete